MALKFRDRDNARDAYRAGISGARSYPGNPDSFQRGRRSAADFRRNRSKLKKPGRTYGGYGKKTFMTKAGDRAGDIIRGIGGDLKQKGSNIKDAIFPMGRKALEGIESVFQNIARSKQNREILGDEYTDDVRKSMMTGFGLREGQEGYEGSDQQFYDKYTRLAGMATDNQERERLMGIANTALQNAQITNRINYALGQPEFGFETTAPAGVANIDYSTLADRMQDGLQGSSIGKAFRAEAIKAANDEKGGNLISDEIMNYRDPIMDMVAPKTPLVSQPELMNVSNQNLMPTYDYNTYGDPMDNILYGEPGSGTGSFLLQSMYPGYEEYSGYENAQKYGLENMTEKELMQFGYENPTLANMFGFNPSRFTESYYGFE